MINEFGAFAAIFAGLCSLVQALAAARAAHCATDRAPLWERTAKRASVFAFLSAAIAFAVLIGAFARSDFSLALAAAHSHVDKPLLYKIAGAWGNHEGSMLMWCLVLSGCSALMASGTGMGRDLAMRALSVQGGIAGASFLYLITLSNPFARLADPPFEGDGLNPLLQDPALAAHPPILYLGYVGLSAAFSIGLAALWAGRWDGAWARALRIWTGAAFAALTVGIALGAYWAYYELGWGGWWFWDPVENASFMPWLAAAALTHSAIVTEKRGGFVAWTVLLSIFGFSLTLLGGFLVRSGVLTSVHAFATDPERGAAILAMFIVCVCGALLLFALRAPLLTKKDLAFGLVSREGALLINNLFLAVGAASVLAGVIAPLAGEAILGRAMSVGPPFFELAFAPLMIPILLAAPFAPFLFWGQGQVGQARSGLILASIAAAGLGALALWMRPDAIFAAFGCALGAFTIFGALALVWDRAGGRLGGLLRLSGPIWAMSLAHIGLGVFAIGATCELGWRSEAGARLSAGQSAKIGGWELTLQEIAAREGPNYLAETAIFVAKKGARTATITTEKRFYPASRQPTTEVGLLADGLNDLYIAMGERVREAESETFTFRLYYNPLIRLVFLGPGLIALGAGIAVVSLLARRAGRLGQSPALAGAAGKPEPAQ